MGVRVRFTLFARDKHVSRDQDLWPGNRDKGREGGRREKQIDRQADKQTDGIGKKDKERRKKKKVNNSVRKH